MFLFRTAANRMSFLVGVGGYLDSLRLHSMLSTGSLSLKALTKTPSSIFLRPCVYFGVRLLCAPPILVLELVDKLPQSVVELTCRRAILNLRFFEASGPIKPQLSTEILRLKGSFECCLYTRSSWSLPVFLCSQTQVMQCCVGQGKRQLAQQRTLGNRKPLKRRHATTARAQEDASSLAKRQKL
eukprot:2190126-Amphidinium_carterae.1